jgi:hypothetical protein
MLKTIHKKEFLAGGQSVQNAQTLVSHMFQQREIPKVKSAFLQRSWQIKVKALVVASVILGPSAKVKNVVVRNRFQSALCKINLHTRS